MTQRKNSILLDFSKERKHKNKVEFGCEFFATKFVRLLYRKNERNGVRDEKH